jgi:WD40 repeat protein
MTADTDGDVIEPGLLVYDLARKMPSRRHALPNSLATQFDAARLPHGLGTGSAPELVLHWALSTNRRILAACGPHTGSIYHTGNVDQVHIGAPGQFKAVAISQHGAVAAFLVVQPNDPRQQHVLTYNTSTAEQACEVTLGGTTAHRGLCVSPDGRAVACWTKAAISIYDLHSGKHLRRLRVVSGEITTATFSPSAKLLAVGTTLGEVTIWDLTHPANAQRN